MPGRARRELPSLGVRNQRAGVSPLRPDGGGNQGSGGGGEMKVPFIDEAEVPQAKIVLYLLNPEHRAGRSKARFFSGHGYAAERWEEMAEALRTHGRENEVAKQETTPLGVRLVVEGP